MVVHGEKLNNLQISFNSEQDNDHIKYEQISATDTELTYWVVLDKSIDDFCVKGMNDTETEVKLVNVDCEKYSY